MCPFTRMQIIIVICYTVPSGLANNITTPSSKAVEFINSDWKHISDVQLQALPENNEGILGKAASVVDKIMEPVETAIEEAEEEVKTLYEKVESFFQKISGFVIFVVAVIIILGIAIALMMYCRHNRTIENIAWKNRHHV